jgi:Flp pilus assembly pilin Flp
MDQVRRADGGGDERDRGAAVTEYGGVVRVVSVLVVAVDAAVDRLADTILEGGWNGGRRPELEAAEDAISGLNGAETDALFTSEVHP